MGIVDLGWGRATRPVAARDVLRGEVDAEIATGGLTAGSKAPIQEIGQRESQEALQAGTLFNLKVFGNCLSIWSIGPTVALGLSYEFFVSVPV